MEKKNLWTVYNEEQLAHLESLNEDYKKYLDAGKTERECVAFTKKMLDENNSTAFTLTDLSINGVKYTNDPNCPIKFTTITFIDGKADQIGTFKDVNKIFSGRKKFKKCNRKQIPGII